MLFPDWLEIAGNKDYRGPCPHEHVEQATFFNLLRSIYPNTYGKVAIHPDNEGKRSYGQANFKKRQGGAKGASDIVIPGDMCFVIEIKRLDHTKSKWVDGQQEYLRSSIELGAIVFVALGGENAFYRFNELLSIKYSVDHNPEIYRPVKKF